MSASWLAAIYASNQLNRAKFYVINRLEEQLPAAVFTIEWNYRTSGTEDGLTRTRRLYTSRTTGRNRSDRYQCSFCSSG